MMVNVLEGYAIVSLKGGIVMEPSKKIRILLVDDHAVIREGLKTMLWEDSSFEIIAEASNGQDALNMVGRLLPDVVLMDISMPVMNGLLATKAIKKLYPEVKIAVLTHHDSEEYLCRVLEAGASGYIVKSADTEEIIKAVKIINEGQAYISPVMVQFLIQRTVKDELFKITSKNILSPREVEVLKLIADSYTNKEIGEKLFISIKTVQTHRANIMEKLGFTNRTELIKYAINKGYTPLE